MALPRFIGSFLRFQRGLLVWGTLLTVVLVGWCVLHRDAISSYLDSLDRRNNEKNRVEALREQVETLESERETLLRGGFDREKAARERYRLKKPGEHVLYLQPGDPDAPTSTTQRPRFAP